ncbi:hypothetical protein E2C01_014447 [Portunus trituberculatus]|uniref:Uncharacterized protein n=1 Tax=Portunus trituberculatus TaxID=210409 RepID=A0A5B7DIV0_PORTR|nr:hypothetical protein [Portunus trituberculatus]
MWAGHSIEHFSLREEEEEEEERETSQVLLLSLLCLAERRTHHYLEEMHAAAPSVCRELCKGFRARQGEAGHIEGH